MGGRTSRRTLRSDRGQSIVVALVMLPVLLGFAGAAIDGAHSFGEKRRTQSAADAAALAAAQSIFGTIGETCPSGGTPIADVQSAAECYSVMNDGPATLDSCVDAGSTNCFTWPYNSDDMRVEVRISRSVDGFFLDALGLGGLIDHVSARAVAIATPLVGGGGTETITDPGTTETIEQDGTTETLTEPGSTIVETITTPGSIEGAQAFTMSPSCGAIEYNGNPRGAHLGAFATNGGAQFGGAGNQKFLETLGFDGTRCPRPPGEPTGSACSSPANSASCIVTQVDLNNPGPMPLNWPLPPPPLPTPLPVGTAWNAATHYANNCILLAPAGSGFTVTVPPATPGVYCVSGNVALAINNSAIAGDGYTFFALNGARIHIASNGTSVRFYWPSACGARPTGRPVSFTCFGRTIAGYDPLTVLYSTNATAFPSTCETSAVCFNGSNGSLDGDVFTPFPNTFPPSYSPPQGGGTVWVAGGSASAGNGFIASWQLHIEGNGGTYNGTGPAIGGTVTTVTTTTPGGTTTTVTPGTTYTSTVPPSTTTVTTPGSTTSTDWSLDE